MARALLRSGALALLLLLVAVSGSPSPLTALASLRHIPVPPLPLCLPAPVTSIGSFYAASLPLARSDDDDDDYKRCEGVVKGWADSSAANENGEDKLNLKDLLFFLHIPRTGGRTYFHCFLRKLYTNDQECPRSYDKLRFDPRSPDCKLVVSHDDYSLMSKLPRERTSVVTILRNPLDRVFSTYEFSIEVAARFLVHPNLTSAKLMTTRVLKKSRAVSTLDIWPWKYLVPWMREDLFARRDARGSDIVHSSKKVNAYDVADMVMPLHEYINDPIAHEIIHNGATFQITGLTNNSHFNGAHEVRHCVRKHPDLGRLVLEVAKNRLDRMLYVGVTEDHEESARLFAHMVGAQVLSQSATLNLDIKEDLPSGNDCQGSLPMAFVANLPPKSYSDMSLRELIDLLKARLEAKEEAANRAAVLAQPVMVVPAAKEKKVECVAVLVQTVVVVPEAAATPSSLLFLAAPSIPIRRKKKKKNVTAAPLRQSPNSHTSVLDPEDEDANEHLCVPDSLFLCLYLETEFR
ncbi:hypothetical protein PR202_ga18097 [Eleusine coracana subsp. coracana]|uniref:Protein-tyrosine sulfotransferase n=1 Tax=Eleusine coracana subsp. coracana TaxID=191504 RepID=A0AAV5CRU1_ELECO|nr:hypothetical protein PR202_ga18097 [Eleusine coracana subsp. coracana]